MLTSQKTLIASMVALCGLFLQAAPARAEITAIGWDSQGRHEQRLQIAPGRIAELCGKLEKGQGVSWSFASDQASEFNIHYHEGKKVVYPARIDGTRSADGRLVPERDHEYCWMWSNKGTTALQLNLTLSRQP
jgi:hypothetical protein